MAAVGGVSRPPEAGDRHNAAKASRETEHKVELDSGWLLDRETGKTTPWDGIRIFWRFKGERRWRKQVLVPDEEQGQTVESLKELVPEVVARLAERAA